MNTKLTVKFVVSLLSISLMFYGIYASAYAFTYNNSVVILPGNSNVSLAAAPLKIAKTTSKEVVWTPKTLSVNNGQKGNPAYIAVDGIVYDMSKLSAWKGGEHKGIKAGTDATAAFKGSPHAKTILKLAKVVGTYSPKVAAVTSATSKVAATQWTAVTLKQYNGSNGKPAYIAVNGVIYDVSGSKTWRSGAHNGIATGQDVTQAFANSPHSKSLLASLPVVAKMGDAMKPGATVANGKVTSVTGNKINGTLGHQASDDEDEDDDDDDNDDDDDDDHEDDDKDDDDSDHDD